MDSRQQDNEEAFIADVSTSALPPSGHTAKVSKLPGPVAIIRQAWEQYVRLFSTLTGVAALSFLPLLLLMLLIAPYYSTSNEFQKLNIFSPATTTNIWLRYVDILPFLMIIMGITMISFFIMQLWGHLALLVAIRDTNQRVGVIEAYKRSLRLCIPYGWVVLLTAFIIIGSFSFLFIPIIIFSTWFSLAGIILVMENERGMRAMLKSKEYIGNYFIAYAGRLVFFNLIVSFLLTVLIPEIIIGLFFDNASQTIGNIMISISNYLFIQPLGIVYLITLYNHLKARKDPLHFAPSWKKALPYFIISILGYGIAIGLFILFASTAPSWKKPNQTMQSIPSPTPTFLILTPSFITDPTANWKTYTNSLYKYAFRFPDSIKMKTVTEDAILQEEPPDAMHIYLYDPKGNEPYSERIFEVQFFEHALDWSKSWRGVETNLNGFDAIKLTASNDSRVIYQLETPVKGYIYITASYEEGNIEKNTMLDQILSTFKFLDEENSDWETYTNTDLNYEIKYPKPPDGIGNIEEYDANAVIYKNTPGGPITHQTQPYLSIAVYQNQTRTTGVDWITQHSSIAKILESSRNWSTINWLSQENWYLSTDTIATYGYEWYAFGFFEDQVVQISFSGEPSMLKQIVTTFRFLK